MSNAERDLSRFLREQCFRERKGDPLTGFVLRHAAAGAKGTAVDSFDVPENLTSDTIADYAEEMLTRAQSDANGMGPGVHRYVVIPISDGKDLVGRCAFRLQCNDEEYGEGNGDEPATSKGMLAQFMRHNEAYARIMTQGMAQLIGTLTQQNANQSKMVEKLIEQRAKDQEMIEAAKSQEHEREMQLLLTSGNEERKGKLFEHVDALIPIVLNKVAGQAVLNNSEKSALKKFVDTIKPEQLDKLRNALDPAQQIALLHLIKAMQDEEKARANPNGVS